MRTQLVRAILLVVGVSLLPACGDDGDTIIQSGAEDFASGTIVALSNNVLFNVSPSDPSNVLRSVAIAGLPAGVTMLTIDYRLANGRLYGRASNDAVYQIDTASGAALPSAAATVVISPAPLAQAVSFNSVSDRLRYVDTDENNLRFNVDTATSFTDTALSPAGNVARIGYTNRFAGATVTTLYGLDAGTDSLVMIGGIDGVPSPNGGVVTTIGPLGLVGFPSGLTISPSGTAYMSFNVAFVTSLYTVNLTTGAATVVGLLGAGGTVQSITMAP